jgi:1-acyl-sn-glycerol-3-phosphate acyltransferase
LTGGGRLRAAWRLARCVLHGLHGLAIVLWRFPRLDAAARHARIGWWSRGMLRRLGIELRVDGAFTPGAKLVAANHVSWLDILAVHALCPEARFVSKAEVRHWPLVSSLVASAGTLYLERERARDALRVVHDVAAALRAGETVAVFPEGTTGTGEALLPFHANLLQAAISTATPVQPVALRYADARHAVSPAAMWLEGTTLMGSLWKLAGADRLVLHMKVLEPVPTAQRERRALAALLHARVGAALGF